MRVRILESVCQGHGMCVLACAELFVLDDETGHASVLSELVPDGLEDSVDLARRSCPEAAIEVSD